MRKWFTKIDYYVLKKFLSTFLFGILIFSIIASVIDYSQKIDDFVENKAPMSEILFYFLNFIPHIIALLFPLFIFISTIFFTSRMAYKTEAIAMFATGMSFTRFLRPYLVGAFILCGLSYLGNHYIVPLANQNINTFHVNYIWSKKVGTDNDIHMRLNENEYVYFNNFNFENNKGRAFTKEFIEGNLLKEKIAAEHIQYDDSTKTWHLYNVETRLNDGLAEELVLVDSMTLNLALKPQDLDDDERIRETMSTPYLTNFIEVQKERGRENVNFYLIELHKRTAQPWAGFILTIMGACIGVKKVRGGSGLHIAIGIVASALYMFFFQFAQTFSTNLDMNPLIAVWIPNIIFGIITVYLYYLRIR